MGFAQFIRRLDSEFGLPALLFYLTPLHVLDERHWQRLYLLSVLKTHGGEKGRNRQEGRSILPSANSITGPVESNSFANTGTACDCCVFAFHSAFPGRDLAVRARLVSDVKCADGWSNYKHVSRELGAGGVTKCTWEWAAGRDG